MKMTTCITLKYSWFVTSTRSQMCGSWRDRWKWPSWIRRMRKIRSPRYEAIVKYCLLGLFCFVIARTRRLETRKSAQSGREAAQEFRLGHLLIPNVQPNVPCLHHCWSITEDWLSDWCCRRLRISHFRAYWQCSRSRNSLCLKSEVW